MGLLEHPASTKQNPSRAEARGDTLGATDNLMENMAIDPYE